MKLWIDDVRLPPDDSWIHAENSDEALSFMQHCLDNNVPLDSVAYDHDLGGDDNTRKIIMWQIEHNLFPSDVIILTANPVGREWIVGMINRYFPDDTKMNWSNNANN